MMKKSFFVAIMTLLTFGLAHAQSKVGTSAATFLGMPVGARALALGSAYVAVPNDVVSIYYNPGSMSYYNASQVKVSHTNWLVDTKYDWAGVVINLDGSSAVGITITQLNYGEDIVTTETEQNGTGETWSAADLSIGFSYSRNLTDRFSIGGTAKYIQQKIWNSSASSFALDVGLIYNTGFNGLKIGMSIANFGSDMRMDGKDLFTQIDLDDANSGNNGTIVSRLKTDDYPLPLLFRAGVSMDAVQNEEVRVTFAADALRPSDNAESINVGGEVAWREMFFVRGGKRSLFMTDAIENYSVGGGLRYELTAVNAVSIDYSYQNFAIFGGIQTFEIGITF